MTAIEALSERELPHVQVVRLRPGDVLVFHVENPLTDQEFEDIAASAKKLFPHNEAMVIEAGTRLAVVRRDSD